MEHRDIPATEQHGIVRWLYANEAAMLAASVTADDLYKVAQVGVGVAATFHVLNSVAPNVYVAMSGTPSSPYVTGMDFSANTLTLSFSSGPDISVIGIAADADLDALALDVGTIASDLAATIASVGQPNGIAALDALGVVPDAQVPSYTYANLAAFPPVGASGKIYCAEDTGKLYIPIAGPSYQEVSAGLSAIPTMTMLGNNTGGSAIPTALSSSDARTMLGFGGASYGMSSGGTYRIPANVNALLLTNSLVGTFTLNVSDIRIGNTVYVRTAARVTTFTIAADAGIGISQNGYVTRADKDSVFLIHRHSATDISVVALPPKELVYRYDDTSSPRKRFGISTNHGASSCDFYIGVEGGAAFSLAEPDGTSTKGNARGAGAIDLQTVRIAATQVASGANSGLLWGARNTASGQYAVSGGYASTASGVNSIALGDTVTASGDTSLGIGKDLTVSGYRASGFGQGGALSGNYSSGAGTCYTDRGMHQVDVYGMPNGYGSATGDAQVVRKHHHLINYGPATFTLGANANSATPAHNYVIPTACTIRMTVDIVASDPSSTATFSVWHGTLVVTRGSGGADNPVIQLNTLTQEASGGLGSGWTVVAVADTTNKTIRFDATSVGVGGGVPIRWVMHITGVEAK